MMSRLPINHKFILLIFLLYATPGVSFAYRCDFLSERSMPSWVEKRPDILGYYVGVGSSEMRDTVEEQIESSQQNALVNLGKEISVSVQGKFTDTIASDDSGKVRQEVESVTETRVQELLRGANIKEKWLDRKSCILWTLITVSRESVQAVQREIEEKIQKQFSSKKLILYALSHPENPNDAESRVISTFERVAREIGVKVAKAQPKYVACARGEYSMLCDELADTIFGGFEFVFDKEKISDDGHHRGRFYKFSGALYFKDRRVTAFNVSCHGVGAVTQSTEAIEFIAADTCVSEIRKKLKEDLQGSE
jgi:hypothetical protein